MVVPHEQQLQAAHSQISTGSPMKPSNLRRIRRDELQEAMEWNARCRILLTIDPRSMAYILTKKSDFDPRLASLLPDYSHAPPDARIIDLLETNAPPTPIEIQSLQTTLSETPNRIAELDSLIDSTASLLRYLTNDRNQALENQANAKKILLHVVDFQTNC
ncbi:hypothetical protein IW261DRAFT_1574378 [Armillaria novae-zelandiae]|uniref:Uncharacterized protein n=1 Tax=Armillaria novae-zelandiae TaxID=153914 RepID=A0AA39NJ68_9AGAR|nr:hypothetical protein IW261DRAFT_1574378 [Armillaria novae-zelandiae]